MRTAILLAGLLIAICIGTTNAHPTFIAFYFLALGLSLADDLANYFITR